MRQCRFISLIFATEYDTMKFLKISAVSYLNTFPFVFGLEQSGLLKNSILELDVPSVCAEKLKKGAVDIALIPAGALPDFPQYHFISPYCIGAVKEVRTVLLLSKVRLQEIRTIHLDFDSRTSVELVKVLSKNYWKISPGWKNLSPGEAVNPAGYESLVAIGDKTFEIRRYFPYVYDLAEEWIKFTGLPFVFALWISRTKLAEEITGPFSAALAFGVERKAECLEYFRDKLPAYDDCLSYLEENISFVLDEKKWQGLELFLSYLK